MLVIHVSQWSTIHLLVLPFLNRTGNTSSATILTQDQKIVQFGWFHTRPLGRQGQHGITRYDLGDYWKFLHGSHHVTRGRRGRGRQFSTVDMWIPDSKCQGLGEECTWVRGIDDGYR
jgi:hypothetical protein